MRTLSLRAKLILGTLAIQIAIVAAVTYNANRIAQDFLMEQVGLRVESTVPLMNAAIAGPIVQHDYVSLNEILADISRTLGLTNKSGAKAYIVSAKRKLSAARLGNAMESAAATGTANR